MVQFRWSFVLFSSTSGENTSGLVQFVNILGGGRIRVGLVQFVNIPGGGLVFCFKITSQRCGVSAKGNGLV